jgi:hypothetical protein
LLGFLQDGFFFAVYQDCGHDECEYSKVDVVAKGLEGKGRMHLSFVLVILLRCSSLTVFPTAISLQNIGGGWH